MTYLGSFSLFHEKPLRELIEMAHDHGVYVSTVCLQKLEQSISDWHLYLFCRVDGLSTSWPIPIRMLSSTDIWVNAKTWGTLSFMAYLFNN
jgi:hypothetical protein